MSHWSVDNYITSGNTVFSFPSICVASVNYNRKCWHNHNVMSVDSNLSVNFHTLDQHLSTHIHTHTNLGHFIGTVFHGIWIEVHLFHYNHMENWNSLFPKLFNWVSVTTLPTSEPCFDQQWSWPIFQCHRNKNLKQISDYLVSTLLGHVVLNVMNLPWKSSFQNSGHSDLIQVAVVASNLLVQDKHTEYIGNQHETLHQIWPWVKGQGQIKQQPVLNHQ